MIGEYIEEALKRAHYEIIDDEEPYYGEITELKGVWATGKTLEGCRSNLRDVVEGWIILSIKKGLIIPKLGEYEGVCLGTSEDIQGLVAQGRTVAETLEIARDVARRLLEAQEERKSKTTRMC
jgi:predicted RNase H-like HicB family nuclease